MDESVNIVALMKDGERFVFVFDEESSPQLLQTLGHYAADPEMNFTWYDAAVLSQKVRRLQSQSVNSETKPFRRSA